MARSINRDMESIYQGANRGVLADVDVLNRINEVRGVWGMKELEGAATGDCMSEKGSVKHTQW